MRQSISAGLSSTHVLLYLEPDWKRRKAITSNCLRRLLFCATTGCTAAFHCCTYPFKINLYSFRLERKSRNAFQQNSHSANWFGGSDVRWQLFIHFNAILRCLWTNDERSILDEFPLLYLITSFVGGELLASLPHNSLRLQLWGRQIDALRQHSTIMSHTRSNDNECGQMGRGGRVADCVTEWS